MIPAPSVVSAPPLSMLFGALARAVQASPGGDPANRGADPEAFPDLVQGPRGAEAARVQRLHLAPELGGTGRGDRLLRGQEPGDRGHQPSQPGAVHLVGPPEVVDHLRHRVAADRVPLVVRQLQIRHHRAIPVGPPRLPQEHAYNIAESPQLTPRDPPKLVCLQRFRLWNLRHHT